MIRMIRARCIAAGVSLLLLLLLACSMSIAKANDEVSTTNTVVDVALIDVVTHTPVIPSLRDGDVLDRATAAGHAWTIAVTVDQHPEQQQHKDDIRTTTIKSVDFLWDGIAMRTETVAPYLLGGNVGEVFRGVPALTVVGPHRLEVTVVEKKKAQPSTTATTTTLDLVIVDTTSVSEKPSSSTIVPSDGSSDLPSDLPSQMPQNWSSDAPSEIPSDLPSHMPSDVPSNIQSDLPSDLPSSLPSNVPSDMPSDLPSRVSSDWSSDAPSKFPSPMPSNKVAATPSYTPSATPSRRRTNKPTATPTVEPSTAKPSDAAVSGRPTVTPTIDSDEDDLLVVPGQFHHAPMGALTGELRQWHRITLGFHGPRTSESSHPNPFTTYRLTVRFVHGARNETHGDSGRYVGVGRNQHEYEIPGFFAADGQAAHTSKSSGNVWLAHFVPDKVGVWNWSARFVQGKNIAISNEKGLSAGYCDGAYGTFVVRDTNKKGPDLRGKGRLEYVGEHHLRFAGTGEWFYKVGSDSPENFLSYDEFDHTMDNSGLRKSWEPHVQDYNDGDPTWQNGKGKGIIGVVNYLSEMGMSSYSALLLGLEGDDTNIFPFRINSTRDFDRFDISKLSQWDIVFEHAMKKGLYLHCKLQEHENDQLLDSGRLGKNRKLFYRELTARFSHLLALNWNLGEENTNTIENVQAYADYIYDIDPYQHPVVLHTYPTEKELFYSPLLGRSSFHGVSMQSPRWTVFEDTLEWVKKSAAAGHKWIVANDEQNPAGVGVVPDRVDFNHSVIRKDVLWGNIMAGGAGIEIYFGSKYNESDITAQDMRSRHQMWVQARHARDFLSTHKVPFWEMTNSQNMLSVHGGSSGAAAGQKNQFWCLTTKLDSISEPTIVVYLRNGDNVDIDFQAGPDRYDSCKSGYSVNWFNPFRGGRLWAGSVSTIASDGLQYLGQPPRDSDAGEDWVILLRCLV